MATPRAESGTVIAPHDADLERAVLGAALQSADAFARVVVCDTMLFYLEKHRALLRVLEHLAPELAAAPPDLTLVLATGEQLGESIDTELVLLALEGAATTALLPNYMTRLCTLAAERERLAAAVVIAEGLRRGELTKATWSATEERLERARALEGGPDAAPVAVEAHAFLAQRFPDTPALVAGGVLARGSLSILGGAPKVGKSLLTLQLAACVATNTPWLGLPTSRGRVLIVQTEVPEAELQGRWRLISAGAPAPIPAGAVHFYTGRGLHLDEPGGRAVVEQLVESVRPDLLVLDPLSRLYGGEENSAAQVGRLIADLDRLTARSGTAVLLLHHIVKPTADDPRIGGHRLRGSSRLFSDPDSILLFDRMKDDTGVFALSFELRLGPARAPLRLTRLPSLWCVPAGPTEDVLAVSTTIGALPLTWGQVIAALRADHGVSQRTAERMLKKALAAGDITKDRDGTYRHAAINCHDPRDGDVSADA